jgi:(E)-4-hydroxy-3-methyl-but-2-enyl pyrophosphate reductase
MIEIILPEKKLLRPCFGVDRALVECLNLKKKEDYVIYGQLAHNKRLVKKIKDSGISSINKLNRISNIIIRAHGITKNDRKKIKDCIDLTCPFVLAFKEKALEYEKKGYQVVIIGDSDHVEVKNITSYLKNPIVLRTKKEALRFCLYEKIACMSQTTERQETIDELIPILKKKTKEFMYIETRCGETKTRQGACRDLAKKVDLMIIAGETHSANATNLFKIAQDYTKSILVNSGKGLKINDLEQILKGRIRTFDKASKNLDGKIRTFDKASKNLDGKIRTFDKASKNLDGKVGIIASASTPHFVVEEIVEAIKKYAI